LPNPTPPNPSFAHTFDGKRIFFDYLKQHREEMSESESSYLGYKSKLPTDAKQLGHFLWER